MRTESPENVQRAVRCGTNATQCSMLGVDIVWVRSLDGVDGGCYGHSKLRQTRENTVFCELRGQARRQRKGSMRSLTMSLAVSLQYPAMIPAAHSRGSGRANTKGWQAVCGAALGLLKRTVELEAVEFGRRIICP